MPERHRKTILVCGMSGSGKTRFINTATCANLSLGHSIESDTSEIASHDTGVPLLKLGDCEFELVDTPGFQDTYDTDEVKVFHTITTWCYERHAEKRPITGLIYLRSIQESRVLRPETTLMQMLKQFWGEDRLGHVLLITNRWQQPAEPEEEDRERQIVNDTQRFGSPGTEQVMVRRLDGKYTQADTHRALESFRDVEPVTMRIQQEMAGGLKLAQTAAGQVITDYLNTRIAELRVTIAAKDHDNERPLRALDKLRDQLEELNDLGSRRARLPWATGPTVVFFSLSVLIYVLGGFSDAPWLSNWLANIFNYIWEGVGFSSGNTFRGLIGKWHD